MVEVSGGKRQNPRSAGKLLRRGAGGRIRLAAQVNDETGETEESEDEGVAD
jgi:hypothetical protein